jgi:hypothetical protein
MAYHLIFNEFLKEALIGMEFINPGKKNGKILPLIFIFRKYQTFFAS